MEMIRTMRNQALFAVLALFAGTATGQVSHKLPHVVITTDKGNIEVEVDTARAPITSANFLRYVDAHFYDGGSFYRTVRPDNQQDKKYPIAVIQADGTAEQQKQVFPPIPLERTSKTGLKHIDGTISMARDGPDTATSSFFICIGAQPSLDFGGMRNPDGQGFGAFGRVVRGMSVVRAIQMDAAKGEDLARPARILAVRRK
jgi:peptidyl-prolyl cis-trans isomerase A (cyclophilin A)